MNRFLRLASVPVTLAALLLVGLIAQPAFAQKKGDEIRTADYDVNELTFPDLRDFEVPDPERVELDNGMTVFLLEDHELPTVNAEARISAGSVYEPAKKRGLASVTGTVMRTGGTESMSPDSVNTVLENLGATVETNIGETSGSAYMSTLSDNVDTVLPVFARVLRNPAFAEEKIQQAKSQEKSQISRRNDNARQIASREFDKILYGEDSPYARTEEYYTIDRIERQDLVDFHEQYVHPSNVILSVWGDFDADEMEEKILEQFGDWEAEADAESPTPPKPEGTRKHSVNFVQKSDVNQSTVFMGHPGEITRKSDDYAPVTVMNEVLSGGFSGRLFQQVRKEKGLAYSVFGQYSANYNRPGRFFAGVFSKSPTTVEATNAVTTEVKRMKEKPPTDEELSLAKDSYLNSFVFNFDTEREILDRRMTYEYYDYPADFLQQTKENIEDVTADDVLSVAKKYLHPEEAHILIVGKKEDFSQSLSTLTEDGSVNEIDISIPTSPPGEKTEQQPMSAEAKAAGMKALKKARSALGGDAFAEIENIRAKGMRSVSQGGQKMEMDLTTVQSFPDQLRAEINTPRGTMVMMINGDDGMQKMGGKSRAMPAEQVKQQKAGLWRNIPYLMANVDHEGLAVQDQGTEEVEGTTYRALTVSPPAGDSYTLYLEPESMRPARMSYTAKTRRGPKDAMSVLENYKKVSGVMIPHKTVTYQDGEKSSAVTLESVTINADLSEDLFTGDDQSEE